MPQASQAATPVSHFKGLLISMRLHQWAKNLLVFVPMVLGGDVGDFRSWLATFVAFLAMGIVASSTYMLNDVVDAASDRQHWSKSERPIAKGHVPIALARICAAGGLVLGISVAALVSWPTAGVLLAYAGLTVAYSFGLKKLPLIDGAVLAALFTLRLALGVVASQVPPSPWLFVFSMFLFTSLSLAKRYTELDRSAASGSDRLTGRGYRDTDTMLVLAIGVATGLCAVVIMVFYILDDAFRMSFKGSALSLWGFPPVVFLLVCRVWLVAARGEMDDDLVRFALRDRHFQFLIAMLGACFALARLI